MIRSFQSVRFDNKKLHILDKPLFIKYKDKFDKTE